MKIKFIMMLTFLFIAGLFVCSPFVYPRAGSGQKYKPPSRPSSSSYSRPSNSGSSSSYKSTYTPSKSTPYRSSSQYKYTPSSGYNNYNNKSNTYNNKNYHKDHDDDDYRTPINQAPIQSGRPSGGCCCAPCGIFGITLAAAFISFLILGVLVL